VHGGDSNGAARIDVRPSWMRRVEAVVTDIFMLIATSLSVHVPATTPYVQKLSLFAFGASRDFVARSYEAFTHPGTNYHSVRYSEVELFVPSDNAAAAFRDYQAFLAKHMEATPAQRAKLAATHDWCNMNAVAPLRTTAVDDIPLSPAGARSIKDATAAAGASDQTVVAFSFTLIYRHNFARCARELQTLLGSKYGARPHFGKFYKPMLMTRADVARMYGAAAVESFAAAVKSVDPHGLFRPRELEVLFIGE
jgi:hypothetical protein